VRSWHAKKVMPDMQILRCHRFENNSRNLSPMVLAHNNVIAT
jgi:hypothetical protein